MLACIITAGGVGSRFASKIPKQYHKIGNTFILQKTIDAFKSISNKIIVIIRKEDEEFFKTNFKDIEYTFGGKTRQASVLCGLEYLYKIETKPKFVLITDAVRPFVSNKIIQDVVEELKKGEEGVVPCLPMQDTIKKVQNGYILETLDRNEIFLAQTPQGFNFETIYKLHQKYKNLSLTDDVAILEKENIKVKVTLGEKTNIKITTPEDLI